VKVPQGGEQAAGNPDQQRWSELAAGELQDGRGDDEDAGADDAADRQVDEIFESQQAWQRRAFGHAAPLWVLGRVRSSSNR
jgi:hypothetical protein